MVRIPFITVAPFFLLFSQSLLPFLRFMVSFPTDERFFLFPAILVAQLLMGAMGGFGGMMGSQGGFGGNGGFGGGRNF